MWSSSPSPPHVLITPGKTYTRVYGLVLTTAGFPVQLSWGHIYEAGRPSCSPALSFRVSRTTGPQTEGDTETEMERTRPKLGRVCGVYVHLFGGCKRARLAPNGYDHDRDGDGDGDESRAGLLEGTDRSGDGGSQWEESKPARDVNVVLIACC